MHLTFLVLKIIPTATQVVYCICTKKYNPCYIYHGIAPVNAPFVKVTDADDHIKQGTNPIGLGQTVAPNEAIWPPMESPWEMIGENCCFSHQ